MCTFPGLPVQGIDLMDPPQTQRHSKKYPNRCFDFAGAHLAISLLILGLRGSGDLIRSPAILINDYCRAGHRVSIVVHGCPLSSDASTKSSDKPWSSESLWQKTNYMFKPALVSGPTLDDFTAPPWKMTGIQGSFCGFFGNNHNLVDEFILLFVWKTSRGV